MLETSVMCTGVSMKNILVINIVRFPEWKKIESLCNLRLSDDKNSKAFLMSACQI